MYQLDIKYTKWPQKYETAKNNNIPKLVFLVCKSTIWQP
jgi:hypothetical protein